MTQTALDFGLNTVDNVKYQTKLSVPWNDKAFKSYHTINLSCQLQYVYKLLAISVDSDQTAPQEQSDLGLDCCSDIKNNYIKKCDQNV